MLGGGGVCWPDPAGAGLCPLPQAVPDGLWSDCMCVKMIMVMWITHVGDLKLPVISILQERHYITIESTEQMLGIEAEWALETDFFI